MLKAVGSRVLGMWRHVALLLSCTVFPAVALTACDYVDVWKVDNKTDQPLEVFINGRSAIAFNPGTAIQFAAIIRPISRDEASVYEVQAFEFVQGRGNLTHFEKGTSVMTGGPGDIVFCHRYTAQEMVKMNRTITITQSIDQQAEPACPWTYPATPEPTVPAQ